MFEDQVGEKVTLGIGQRVRVGDGEASRPMRTAWLASPGKPPSSMDTARMSAVVNVILIPLVSPRAAGGKNCYLRCLTPI